MSQRSRNHQNSTKSCWFYNTSRGCKHGCNCRFAHDINQHSIYGGMVQAIFNKLNILEQKLNETSKRVHFNEQKEPEKESLMILLQTANEKIEKLEKRITNDNETYNKLFKSNMALQKSYGISQEKVKYSQEQISSMSKDMATTWGEARDREIENRKLKEELKEKEELLAVYYKANNEAENEKKDVELEIDDSNMESNRSKEKSSQPHQLEDIGGSDCEQSQATKASEVVAHTSYSSKFMEIAKMVSEGRTPDDVKVIDDMPQDPKAALSESKMRQQKNPWEKNKALNIKEETWFDQYESQRR